MTSRVGPELLAALLDEHGAALELFAAQWTESPEDCVQEAFVELASQPQSPRSVAAWLFRVVKNRAIGRLRADQRRKKHERLAAALTPNWSQPSTEPLVSSEELAAALYQLDEPLREVVVMRTWGGLSFEQIAEVIDASTSAAHRRYEAGLAALRQLLSMVDQPRASRREP